ncbi:hypothetical protein L7F22_007816 [Adiantum nelumboides]|nr:hypothetical protein [Adiantum nelumboides]
MNMKKMKHLTPLFESSTEVVSTFSDGTSSVMFNMVQKPCVFPKKAKVRAESSSSTPATTSGSEESKPSWMKKRRPSTLNLSKKEQRDYRLLPLFSNMVEQAEEIAKTEEWRRIIHPGLRQNSGNLHSPVLQQTASTDFAIPKTLARPSPSVVEKQLEKERQDRYCAEEHQLKAIQTMFSALEQIAYRMIVRTVNTCLPFVYNAGYLCNNQSQEKDQNIVMKVDPTSQGSLPDLVQWQEVEFPTKWKLDISKTLLNEAQQPMKMSIERLGLTDQYKLLGKSKSRKDFGLLMQRPQYREIRIDAMVKAKQSTTPLTTAAPPSTASQQLVPLNYNTSASSSILPRMFLALQSSAILPNDFSQSESLFIADNLEEPDSISDSEPEVINEDDEVRRLNLVKMKIDDVKVEEPSTSASTSSTSLSLKKLET